MQKRNATVAIIGAGDFIGSEIAKKFAANGFTVFVGRRNGEKHAPLQEQIKVAGGVTFGRSLDARTEDKIAAFLSEAELMRRLKFAFSISAPMSESRSSTQPGGLSAKYGKWSAIPAFWQVVKRRA